MLIPAGLLLFLLLLGVFLAWEHSSIIGAAPGAQGSHVLAGRGVAVAVPPTRHLCPGTAKPSRWSRVSTRASTPPSSSWLPATSLKPPCSCDKSVGAHPRVGDKDPPGMETKRWGLLASGHPRSSFARVLVCRRRGDGLLLPCPGVKLSCLQGRKGSPEELHYYWDVGFCLGAGILANDLSKVIQASEKLYKLNAPGWYGTARHVPTWARLGLQSLVSVLQEGV